MDTTFSRSRNKVGLVKYICEDQGRIVLAKANQVLSIFNVDEVVGLRFFYVIRQVKELHLNNVSNL